MATSKKSKKKALIGTCLTFLAGLALPVSLAIGWHVAYGQQQTRAAEPVRQQPAQSPPQTTAALQNQQEAPAPKPVIKPAAFEPAERPSAEAEFDDMRKIFQSTVQQPAVERYDRYRKAWKNAPKVQQAMEERRNRLEKLDKQYTDFVKHDLTSQMSRAGVKFETSQYFVYADRNPTTQYVLVGFYDAERGSISFLGADLISSGNLEKGGDYYETPTGVFENLVDNFGYRAQGTPNQEGWRGLGAKDSRVWDFGDQKGIKKYKGGNTVSQMRLLMHSTDPDKGEPRLGRTDSKGCVRISHSLNRFLDTYAILDFNYELWARTKPDSWLLRKDRRPVAYPGKYLIIGDSSQHLTAQAKP